MPTVKTKLQDAIDKVRKIRQAGADAGKEVRKEREKKEQKPASGVP